jgi:hypothetical protein
MRIINNYLTISFSKVIKLILSLPVMKIPLNLLFRIIFLMAVLFSFEINVYSNDNVQLNNMEVSTGRNVVENSFNSNLDLCDDDQITNFNRPGLLIEFRSQPQILQNFFLILNGSVSVWHPPKIS